MVCGEAGFRLRGTEDSLVGIDVALVSADLSPRRNRTKGLHGPPSLAVEILSPNDTHEDIVEMVSSLPRGWHRRLGRRPRL